MDLAVLNSHDEFERGIFKEEFLSQMEDGDLTQFYSKMGLQELYNDVGEGRFHDAIFGRPIVRQSKSLYYQEWRLIYRMTNREMSVRDGMADHISNNRIRLQERIQRFRRGLQVFEANRKTCQIVRDLLDSYNSPLFTVCVAHNHMGVPYFRFRYSDSDLY